MFMLVSVCTILHGENGSHPAGLETGVCVRVVLEREDRDVVSHDCDGGFPEVPVDLPVAWRPR